MCLCKIVDLVNSNNNYCLTFKSVYVVDLTVIHNKDSNLTMYNL